MLRPVVRAVSLMLLTGCTYNQLNPQGSSVKVSSAAPPGSCVSLGHVQGKGGGGGGGWVSNESLVDYALNDIRNHAAELGATHVVAGSPSFGTHEGTTTSASVTGEAFKCSEAKAEPLAQATLATAVAPEVIGCTTDVQCKGDRICVERQCVDPKPSSGGEVTPASATPAPEAALAPEAAQAAKTVASEPQP